MKALLKVLKAALIAALTIVVLTSGKPVRTSRYVYVAAADSAPADKKLADFRCTGTNDELTINKAIASLPYGGTVQLLDGRYNIDSFPNEVTVKGKTEHIAIFFGAEDPAVSRTVNLIGTTENKSYNTHFGVHIHVTENAIRQMNDVDSYIVIGSSDKRPDPYGSMTWCNNANFENFYLYIGEAQKKMVGIACNRLGGSYIKQVGIYTESYFQHRFEHTKPPTPVVGSIGVISCSSSNDEMARIGWDTLNCGGMYIGALIQQVDHLIMMTCTFARCVYALYCTGGTPKTMTIINSCDEGCVHLPHFGGRGHVTAIDYNIERFNLAYYPDDPTGDTEFYATEDKPGSWIGTFEYTLQGWSGADPGKEGQHFWRLGKGEGKGIRTRNLNYDHTGVSKPNCPEYLERYFDTEENVWKTWNGSEWLPADK